MCFGDTKEKTETSSQTVTPPAWLQTAAQGNIDFAKGLQDKGFTPYTGSQVAPFSAQQQGSFGMGADIAGGVQPYVGEVGGLLNNYANAGPGRVNASTIASQMSPYMNQYVSQALAPQLEQQNQQFNAQNKSFDSSATGAGAFGDTGFGLGRSNLTQQQDTARTGLVGQAYTNAFNTAIGAGAQDVSNKLNAQTTNANLRETALNRQLTGANAITGAGTNAANINNQFGAQQTAQGQAGLNAAFNQWMMAQQYPFQTAQLNNQTLGAARAGAPITTDGTKTTSAPDNSGFGMIGAALPLLAAPFTGGASLAAMPAMMGAMGSRDSSGNPSGAFGSNPQLPNGNYNPAYAADGGQIQAGQPTVVGERGPEVIVPGQNAMVIPNEILQAARALRAKKTGQPDMQFGLAA